MAAAVDYDYPWDQIIARFKFRDEPGWAAPLAQLMLRHPAAKALLTDSDLVVPVPVTQKRLAQRGYNQSWELVKAMRRRLGAAMPPCNAECLLRIGEAPDQHDLPRALRLKNLISSFVVHPDASATVTGQRILLVDDVCTTGTTLQQAALILRKAGAASVCAITVARTLDE